MSKVSFLLSVMLLSTHGQATIHINMFSSPQTITHWPGNNIASVANYYIVDSTDYLEFVIATNSLGVDYCFTQSGTYYTQVDTDINKIASILTCVNPITIDSSRWRPEASVAQEVGDANFDNKGVNYMIFKHRVSNGYNYGWIKISSSITGDTLTVYGYGYNDEVSSTPNILAGEGECVSNILPLALPDNAIRCFNGLIVISYQEPLDVRILDVEGRFIRNLHFIGGQADYETSSFPHGVYFLEINLHGLRQVKRIIL